MSLKATCKFQLVIIGREEAIANSRFDEQQFDIKAYQIADFMIVIDSFWNFNYFFIDLAL